MKNQLGYMAIYICTMLLKTQRNEKATDDTVHTVDTGVTEQTTWSVKFSKFVSLPPGSFWICLCLIHVIMPIQTILQNKNPEE